MQKFFWLVLFFFIINTNFAQELNCQISVNHSKIQGTNNQVFQSLQSSIYEFMNRTKWTDNVFEMNERIECNILIIINEFNNIDKFKSTIQITSSRTAFNSSYNTKVFNFKEEDGDFQFQYYENQALEFNENTHTSNLTSVLAFYAYIVLGLDYDTYSPEGGNPYFQKAQKIVNNAQSSADLGWKAYESKNQNNRYFIADGFNNKLYAPLRRAFYGYHRLGLDAMNENVDVGRKQIYETFRQIQKVHRSKPNSFLVQLFFNAKSDEIVNIFSDAPVTEVQQAFEILKEIDVANITKYEKLREKK